MGLAWARRGFGAVADGCQCRGETAQRGRSRGFQRSQLSDPPSRSGQRVGRPEGVGRSSPSRLRPADPARCRAHWEVCVHRVLVRNGLVRPQEQQRQRKYKRWQREAPMHLWQLDLVGGVFLADGRECKILTAIDDRSRFVVAATVLERPTGGAVVEAFTAAIRRYGVPFEVLTDNGKQFTGRFTRPVPAEVLFERTCREYGVTHRVTKRRSPTTTGKIERWHQTLRRELLDEAWEFADIHAAQDAQRGGDRRDRSDVGECQSGRTSATVVGQALRRPAHHRLGRPSQRSRPPRRQPPQDRLLPPVRHAPPAAGDAWSTPRGTGARCASAAPRQPSSASHRDRGRRHRHPRRLHTARRQVPLPRSTTRRCTSHPSPGRPPRARHPRRPVGQDPARAR
ncbi:DDE-type integrase/transposase/recombinase [Saccharopolyspora shandongensis]